MFHYMDENSEYKCNGCKPDRFSEWPIFFIKLSNYFVDLNNLNISMHFKNQTISHSLFLSNHGLTQSKIDVN